MRILFVAHSFLPRHQAGAELYTYRLARELAHEHDVTIFTGDDGLRHKNYSRRSFTLDNLRVIEVTNLRRYRDFAHSYADPQMEEHFLDVLRLTEPDIVHFQHLLNHSIEYPTLARKLGIPSVLTLHEFWLMCARNGQLIRADGDRCLAPDLDRCARCMSRFLWGRNGFDVWILRAIASVQKVTGVDLKAMARRIRLNMRNGGIEEVPEEVASEMRKELLLREARVRDMFNMIDCLIAPSNFLRDRFVELGFDRHRILHADYGTETEQHESLSEPREPGEPIRIGFLGSVQKVKGVHVFLNALAKLEPSQYRAEIYGNLISKPEYVQRIKRDMPESVEIRGVVDFSQVPGVLRRFDLLVVPSIWWENSPLVIHEAFASGIPVVCSNIGGMAELVEDEVSGLHFEVGDSDDLAAKLQRLIDEPGLLEKLKEGVPPLKSMDEDKRFHLSLYETVIANQS